MTAREERWYERAACRTADPRLFDPSVGNEKRNRDVRRINKALTVCRGCPVQVQCLTEAVEAKDDGVRGGKLLECGTAVDLPQVVHRPRTPVSTSRPQRIQHQRLLGSAALADPEPASLAAIAREESARVYGGQVPEHHGNAVARPASETVWEKARLRHAARTLRGDGQ